MTDEDLKYPHWQRPYQAALSSSDKSELHRNIHAAELAIFERIQVLTQDSGHQTEGQAIADALSVLRKLQREKLSFPNWSE